MSINPDGKNTQTYVNDYFNSRPNLRDTSTMRFVYKTTKSIDDTGFKLMLANINNFESVLGKKEIKIRLMDMIIEAQFSANINSWGKWDLKKWNAYSISLKKKYSAFSEDLLFKIKVAFFRNENRWDEYSEIITKYAKGQPLSEDELNEYAWAVFSNCNDSKVLEKALVWSKKSFTRQTKIEPGYIDTYANILYKLGRKKEALQWEIKAQKIAIEQGADKNWGQDVIDKIIKGEKTW